MENLTLFMQSLVGRI
jgi:hypothetical protein